MTPTGRKEAAGGVRSGGAATTDGVAGQLRAILAQVARSLGRDELRVLVMVAARLEIGQRRYGRLDLASDGRDWQTEALQEAVDFCVYLAADGLRKK